MSRGASSPVGTAEVAASRSGREAAGDGHAGARGPSRKRVVLVALLAVALLAGGYFGYGWWTHGRFFVSTDDAYVGADVTILAAKASGYVTAVEVENNQNVQAGQVIARIDDGDYRLALKAAQDRVATQEAAIERIGRQIEAAEAQVRQAEPQIAAARADAVRTAADYERQARLSQSDFASRARLEQSLADRDRAAANVQAAEAALVAARANVAVLRAQKDEAERVAAEYRTAAARAERDLSFTVVRAPVSGVVGNRAVEVGAYVQPGTRLAALVPLDTVRVDANFKETQLARIRPGQRVELEVDAFPGREFPGVVESIAPASGAQFSLLPPENATGNFTKIVQRVPVRIKVDPGVAEEAVLRPGLSVVVRVDSRDPRTEQASR
ncbi:HlyD family secretion protein [Enterovirga aerilata]|uniref:HlyD family secretion protein n=1 Tax=Enterovirga aerilata TaxID=2730920 RepID=A0A849I1J6_9HYPH|nr:HlyD family secretion protein [Enterovirga sp. DB1703]NNM71464.1 HlyD family secretion protein [Enterovirga sp. DB1703]